MWMARPSSRATASASAISPGSQRVASARCRLNTPMTRSKTTIGVASTLRVPRSRSVSRPPRVASSSSGAVSTSPTATVRRSRAARLRPGSLGATSPTGPDSRRVPLGQDRHRLADLAEPDEGARDVADRPRGLLDGDAERRVDVELGADAPADLGDQALAPERGPQRLVRARAAERQGGFAGQALHDVELGGGEAPVARPRDDDEDADDVALREQRHEGGALRPDGVGERAVDVRRRDRVVDRDGHALADDGHDGAAVRVQPELDAPPPRLVDAARDEPGRRPQLLVDLGEQERVRLEQRLHLVEERPGRLLGGLRLRERGREPRDRVGLAPALGGDLLGLAHAATRGDEKRAVVAADEDDDAGDGDRHRAHDDEPGGLAREDVAARERQAGEQGRDGGHHGEEEPDPQPQARGLALPQERHAEEDRDEPVEARQDQERDGVQEHRLTVGAHRESSGDDRSRAARA